jgi:hypothetical protein
MKVKTTAIKNPVYSEKERTKLKPDPKYPPKNRARRGKYRIETISKIEKIGGPII